MHTILDGTELVLGTCYYPEHWPEKLWKEDLLRMLENGIRVIRIAEFAWSKVEPAEGNFTFDFFDRFLDAVEETDMKVIFCTPTATPPAWLTEKYPEVLNANQDGVLYRHGARRHYNYNSPVYQKFSARITEKYAAHYAKRRCIIGWQIDNELNCELSDFYSESDSAAFRSFLKEKYGSLEELNKAWGTVFWNQTYTDWEEVYVPRTTVDNATNPHLKLDYYRFVSASCRGFAKMQSEILRNYLKEGDFITTNGIFGNVDNHALKEESLDFWTYDSYPNFAYCLGAYEESPKNLKDRKWSRNLTEVRSASPVFGIMEQQSGANGWNISMEAPTPRPGQITLWTMQSIAHGADYVSYFRWRTCTMGTEIYWHGILDYSGRENRRLREVRDVAQKLKNMKEIAGARYEAKAGIIKDYDNIWDAQLDVWHNRVERASQEALFAAAQHTHTPLDFVYLEHTAAEELSKYELLFYPHPTLISEERAALLKEYVAAGGTLVIGCRSGYKDMTGKCVMEKLPGLLSELVGTDIPEYTFIAPDEGEVTIDWDGDELKANIFVDQLEAQGDGAKVLARYTSDYYAGAGALVGNSYGKGKAYYYGTAFHEEAARIFLEKLGAAEPYSDLVSLPENCEIAVRSKKGVKYLFLLNYDRKPAKVTLKKAFYELCAKSIVSGEQTIPGYGVLVLRLENENAQQ